MASTLQSGNAQQYVDFDEYIDYQLQKTRGNIKSTDVLTAFAFVAVFVLAYLLLFVICDHWLVPDGFSQGTRMILLSLVGLLSVGWLMWKVVWPYLRQVNQLFAAKLIEKSQPELRSTLLNLIDARSAGKDMSPEILAAMEKRAAISMSQTNVDEAVDRRPLMWACYAVLGLVVLFSLYTLFTPKKVSASIWRALFPVSAVEAPTQTVIEKVSPGDAEVIPGSRLEVLVDISGQTPEKITLYYTTADREFVDEPIEMREVPDMPRRYRAEIIGTNGEGIQQDLNYHITAGDDRSLNYAVTVFQPPSAEIVELHSTYPKYMERESKTRTTGAIDDYEGVIVTFLAEANMPLKTATITFHDDRGTNYRAEAIPMASINAQHTRFRATWVLSISPEDGTYPRYYSVECRNDRGETDPNPTRWPIRIHPDKRPEARILNPKQSELERPANAILPLTAYAQDDFKVASLELWKQLNDQPPVKHITLFEGGEPSFSVDYDWPLSEGWSLKEGDKVSYWVKAYDNRTPEAQTINSDKYTILIKPERPQEEIEQQLENDRRPEQPNENPNEDSEKNPDNSPPQNGNEENETDPDQPKSEQPQSQQDKGNTGDEGDPSQSDSAEGEGKEGEGGSKSRKNGKQGESVANDGSQDDKALESLNNHFNRNKPPEPGQENSNPNQPNPENPDNKTPPNNPNENPDNETDPNNSPDKKGKPENQGDKPKDKPEGTEPNPDSETKPGENPEKKPGEKNSTPSENTSEGMNEGMPDPKSKSPKSEGMNEENKNDPNNSTKPDSTSEKKEQKPNENGTEKKPNPETKPSADKTGEKKPMGGGSPKPPEGENPDGGTDDKPGTGKPSDSPNPAETKTADGEGGNETEPDKKGGPGKPTDKPLTGNETPSDPDNNAKKRDATGEEKGKGTAEDDPDAKAKPAKNNIERKDPEKPATTRNREGEPENPPVNPESAPDAKPGPKNPDSTDRNNLTKKPGQPNQNPDEQTQPRPETNPERNPAKSKDHPNAGDDEIKGKGRPEGQQAKKPEGGEAGSSKQNKEGTPGGEEKGPGDKTPRPGEAEASKDPKEEGKPSQERGKGSRTKETKRKKPAPPGQGDPSEGPETEPMPGAERPNEDPTQPGTPGGPSRPQQSPDASSDRTGDAGQPGGFGEGDNPGKTPVSAQDAQAAEEANLEYGRQATDLALKRLENQIERGEVNEDWLKEMGWDKADASQFLDRMKDRMNQRDANTPEALAKQRQFNEWLKRLNKPKTNAKRRVGSEVRNLGPRDLINTRNSTPPAELRDIYEAYQRGISERSK